MPKTMGMTRRRPRAQLTVRKPPPLTENKVTENVTDSNIDMSHAADQPSSPLTELSHTPSLPADYLQEDFDDGPDSVSDSDHPEDAFIALLSNGELQYIADRRTAGKSPLRHFELLCVLKDSTKHWIPEAVVQLFNNAAVCTYWHAREDTNGNSVGRPYDEVDPQVLKIVKYDEVEGQFWVQMVGDPVFDPEVIPSIEAWSKEPHSEVLFRYKPIYITRAEVEEKWPHQYEAWKNCVRSEDDTDEDNTSNLQIVFGHRKNRKYRRFEFSYLSRRKAPKSFFKESFVQGLNGPALLIYWESNPGLRRRQSDENPKVPVRPFRIVNHRLDEGGQLLFTFQKVGGSEIKVDLVDEALASMIKLDEELIKKYMRVHRLSRG